MKLAQSKAIPRIEYLDGLRGIAILAVMFYHAYVCWPDRLPFGDRFSVLPIRLGWEGVQLFFLISGFVIVMTLERCRSLPEFLWRRWLRLFPAMLIASAMIFLLYRALGEQRPLADLLPGLLFVNPSLIHTVTRMSLESMDGAFWTLYVEVMFYLFFGAAYFLAGARKAIAFILVLYLIALSSEFFFGLKLETLASRIAAAEGWIGFINFGWFASGALFYLFAQSKHHRWLWLAVSLGLFCGLTSDYAVPEKIGFSFVVVLFTSATLFDPFQRFLSSKPLLFFGFISYPLYLLHSTLIGTTLNPIARLLPQCPEILWPIIPIALSILVAWAIAKIGEPALRNQIKSIQFATSLP